MSSDLIHNLECLNRKERYHLIQNMSGQRFRLSTRFKKLLGNEVGLTLASHIPFVAIDYHLDWLYAALYLTKKKIDPNEFLNGRRPIRGAISGTQQDIDLLIAYPGKGTTHLILIEAKADSPWTSSQIKSKSKHLKKVFGQNGDKWGKMVKPHLVLMSPETPDNLRVRGLPEWMVPRRTENSEQSFIYIPLGAANRSDLFQLVRCDHKGKVGKDGGCWKLKSTKWLR